MTSLTQKVYIHGRLRGLTKRRITLLASAAGFGVTRRPAGADAIVLAHNTAGAAVSVSGALRLGFRPKADARVMSELSFKSRLGIIAHERASNFAYSDDQIARRSGLGAEQLRTLSLYDILNPDEGWFSYQDVVAARAVARLVAGGVDFPRIIAAALALERRGASLSSVRLAEAPWGELVQHFEDGFARLDGQLLLPFEGEKLNAEEAFVRAEASEQAGDLESARKWYDIAARLDETDPVIPFNLGNVLDELGRLAEAEVAYRNAIERGPELADAWFNLGVLLEKTGREDEALASYGRAFLAEPSYVDALHNAALLHMRRLRFAAALALLERILALAPGNAAAVKRLAHLCRLELKHGAG
ncbi:MAG TPA: tetratricopeptide repeat protein [Roseiarcus sp.]|nr:tetratricopeptide repeat protein [Roseiarcus sp.]